MALIKGIIHIFVPNGVKLHIYYYKLMQIYNFDCLKRIISWSLFAKDVDDVKYIYWTLFTFCCESPPVRMDGKKENQLLCLLTSI